jgi:hypothetical protein
LTVPSVAGPGAQRDGSPGGWGVAREIPLLVAVAVVVAVLVKTFVA